jgi:N-acetyl-1-D-myo-inositol-2-amino-2-deoxy-alpha-D-glucopyranoside deacetylase
VRHSLHSVTTTHPDSPHRLLLVHAHPDDETIGTGATMAKYAAAGAHVTLITCTLGEEGEILVPELEHLAADLDGGLGEHRIGELADAMAVLGVADHRFLGGPGRWRDSGMMGTPPNDRPDAFWQADLDEAVGDLVQVIREVRPQVVISYDDNGGYGHPDHIQAHRVAIAGFDAAGDPTRFPGTGAPWTPSKFYEAVIPISILQNAFERLRELGEAAPFGVTSPDELPFGVPDDQVTTVVDARPYLEAKMAAMRAYPTQIAVDGQFFALSNDVGQGLFGLEHYRLVRGAASTVGEQETDLFAGVS